MSWASCTELVRKGDPDRFLSAMTARPEMRGRLFALYAFNLEVARAPWVTAEEMIAEMRLQWWADVIGEIYAGETVRAHEVVGPLSEIIAAADLPRGLFDGLIEARRFDIYRKGHKDRAAFDRYIDATGGNLMQLAARALGAGAEAELVIADFAYGAGVANLVRALPRLYAAGRDPVPTAKPLDLSALASGEIPTELQKSLREIGTLAQARIRKARTQRNRVPAAARPALLAGWMATGILVVAMRRPETLLKTSIEASEFRRKASLLLRSLTGRW